MADWGLLISCSEPQETSAGFVAIRTTEMIQGLEDTREEEQAWELNLHSLEKRD